MALDPGTGVPMYRQLAALLRAAIQRGDYAPGDPIPSEAELVAEHGLSRGTVRQAVSMLTGEGLIVMGQGRRAAVRQRPAVQRLARSRLSRAERNRTGGMFMADAAAANARPDVSVDVLTEPAASDVAGVLGLDDGAAVLIRRRVMSFDGTPVQLATSYLPADIVRGSRIEQVDTGPGGTYARLEELGYTLARYVETVGTRMPLDDEAAALQLAPGTPVLTVTRIAYTIDDQPVELNRMTLAGDRYELVYEIPAE